MILTADGLKVKRELERFADQQLRKWKLKHERKGLILCKDCIFYTGKWCTKYSTKQFDINDIYKDDNDYCSYGKRKEHAID